MDLIILGAVVAIGLLVLSSGLRVVREYQRLVIFRLGRYVGDRGPGLVLLIPGLERAVLADLREGFISVPHQTCITKDNAPINIDFLIYSKVVHPGLSVVNVESYAEAAQGLATTTLRAVIGDIPLDDV